MGSFKAVLLTLPLSALLMTLAPDSMAADKARNVCPSADRLQIQDLDMSPDPVVEGQRIRAWKVRLRFDGPRACETEIFVREGTTIVGREQRYNLRPGIHEIEIQAAQGFRPRHENIASTSRSVSPAPIDKAIAPGASALKEIHLVVPLAWRPRMATALTN